MDDSEKLNKLADWFNFQDALKGNNGHEVQDDLRRIANELTALRSQLVECEKVAEALKSRLDENSNGDLADYDAFDMYEAYKSAHPTEKG